ncbi:MAG TPA: multiheme c-type cytochrome [Nitrospiraceae bacterium]|jgi:nitrate/TMAO reductase-like tetraheme cytochrome c subunit
MTKQLGVATIWLAVMLVGLLAYDGERVMAQKSDGTTPSDWVAEIERIFIRSEDCKQCHDRHYEEWKGVREQTPDLKTFGRVDAALLHGTSLESAVFRTVLGLWMQTSPSPDERRRCLSCHAPSTIVFPQHAERVAAQILAGKPQIEGIGCASCHLINAVERTPTAPPTFKLQPGTVLFGPYADPEENLVHPAAQSKLFHEAAFCVSCHFDKVKDVTQKDLPGEILQGTTCQDCHMEPSTGSSTSRRGAMTRAIGRHWFRGVVVAGTLLRNRNLQAEWMPRIDIDVTKKTGAILEGVALVKIGSLPHSFPDGDPVLKQFFLTVTTKDAGGKVLAEETKQFGLPYERILRGPIPDPFIKGGHTRKVPFVQKLPVGASAVTVEVVLNYALIPTPEPALKERYLATLNSDKEQAEAKTIIDEYTQPRILTYRVKSL